jgi:hypothetical protein
MAREFGKRRPDEPERPENPDKSRFAWPAIDVSPLQFAQGAGYVLLGFVLARFAIGTLFPVGQPEYLRYVFVPGEQRTDLINDHFDPPSVKLRMPDGSPAKIPDGGQ